MVAKARGTVLDHIVAGIEHAEWGMTSAANEVFSQRIMLVLQEQTAELAAPAAQEAGEAAASYAHRRHDARVAAHSYAQSGQEAVDYVQRRHDAWDAAASYAQRDQEAVEPEPWLTHYV